MGDIMHNKYRPQTLGAIFGQKEIVESVRNLFKQEEIPHAFLFSGPSGTGKTSIARIIANMLEADKSDIIEVNIANTGGVDFVRELNEIAKYPSLFGKSKVFILDECQMLTKEGQNAILKLLEDSPKHAYFLLCTTETQKLLLTLKNRCTSFTLKSLSNKEIENLLLSVMKAENQQVHGDILNLLVYKAEGCPRKALVMLNQVKDIKDFEKVCILLADELEAEAEIIELCRMLIKRPRVEWKNLVKTLENHCWLFSSLY